MHTLELQPSGLEEIRRDEMILITGGSFKTLLRGLSIVSGFVGLYDIVSDLREGWNEAHKEANRG